ncbi:hypothetical protein K8B83_18840 [Shewanella inventionis]|jgi:HK97 gp10 family phage protein|uniref:HK97-gp10 family putative phage morphogenesis protein n=1 Tax=Shewanella inventionis TaxID=1738770 RepID=UPI001CBB850C|nr:HK97-gp10 family putative phage morphogenesis protein [Shewanella inventionis]UAL42849.1 hypothetical protein K8B83_18840 [Shewanella inventionis]
MSYKYTHVDGLKELDDALAEIGVKAGTKLLRNAGKAAMQVVLDTAIALVPQDTQVLRESLSLRVSTYKNEKQINRESRELGLTGIDKPTMAFKVGNFKRVKHAGTNIDSRFYILATEFGTSKQIATPFLRPALENNQSQVINTFKQSLSLGLIRESMLIAAKNARAVAKAAKAARKAGGNP